MELDPDLSEFIECCVAREVRFLVVGGYAVAAHGHPRYTKDLDVWVWIDQANVRRLIEALDDFGFGSLGLTDEDFGEPGIVVQLGRPPKRIDLLTSIDGVDFESCWSDRIVVDVGGMPMPVIAVKHLVANKRASGRLQDLADAEALTGSAADDGIWDS
ncbi:hypothetical protein [Pseudonocardia sp.]|uniref:hypothetical protein n=1 Tax=Pseudonocardia sp. TaxID=60912 RepID=UPI00260FE904|nr:hypothetical protein [Pseudonocardia sp.]